VIELNLVGDDTSTQPFVLRILQVPARLRLLDEASHHCVLVDLTTALGVLHNTPHLEVLDSVAILILGRTLPGYNVRPERRETQLVDVVGRKGGDNVAHGWIDNGDPERMLVYQRPSYQYVPVNAPLRRRPRKVSATWGISTAAEIPLRPGEYEALHISTLVDQINVGIDLREHRARRAYLTNPDKGS